MHLMWNLMHTSYGTTQVGSSGGSPICSTGCLYCAAPHATVFITAQNDSIHICYLQAGTRAGPPTCSALAPPPPSPRCPPAPPSWPCTEPALIPTTSSSTCCREVGRMEGFSQEQVLTRLRGALWGCQVGGWLVCPYSAFGWFTLSYGFRRPTGGVSVPRWHALHTCSFGMCFFFLFCSYRWRVSCLRL
jgi:hypothetical protein